MSLSPLTSHFIPAVNKGMTAGNKLMMVLHGRGDTLHSYKIFAQELNVTGLNYLLLNAPFVEGFGYTWYDDSFSTDDLRYQKSMELLINCFQEQAKVYSPENIFLFGFSQGARMSLDLLLKLNQKLAGTVALSPRVTHQSPLNNLDESCKNTPLFVAHGERDPVIPIQETINNLQVFKENFPTFDFHSYPMGHEIDISEIQALRQWMNELL